MQLEAGAVVAHASKSPAKTYPTSPGTTNIMFLAWGGKIKSKRKYALQALDLPTPSEENDTGSEQGVCGCFDGVS